VAPVDGGPALATLVYGDAATVRRANLGLTRRKDEKIRGFWLDTTNGEWLSESKAAEKTTDEDDLGTAEEIKLKQRVIPYVEDRRNVLVLRLAGKATLEEHMSRTKAAFSSRHSRSRRRFEIRTRTVEGYRQHVLSRGRRVC
jgi:hypothetical protein